jgi:gas vesicle protein
MGEDPAAIREETRERMGETVDAIGYKADVPSRAKESLTEKVQGVRTKLAGAGSQIADSVSGAGSQISESVAGAGAQITQATPDAEDVRRAGRQAVGVAQQNPVGLAIGAAAVGFLAGMLIPSTKVEDEQLGAVSDQVRQQIKQTGQEAIEHGKQVAQETAQVATESAKQAATEVIDSAQQTAQQHGEELKSSAQESAQEVRQTASQ